MNKYRKCGVRRLNLWDCGWISIWESEVLNFQQILVVSICALQAINLPEATEASASTEAAEDRTPVTQAPEDTEALAEPAVNPVARAALAALLRQDGRGAAAGTASREASTKPESSRLQQHFEPSSQESVAFTLELSCRLTAEEVAFQLWRFVVYNFWCQLNVYTFAHRALMSFALMRKYITKKALCSPSLLDIQELPVTRSTCMYAVKRLGCFVCTGWKLASFIINAFRSSRS